MQNLSDFIGKALYTKAGERAGTIKNALLSKNLKTLRAFEYFDEQEDEHTLPAAAIACGQDALIVKALAERQFADAVPAPFGIEAFSETGGSLGNVCDFMIEGNQVKAVRLTSGKEAETARIAGVKDALLFDLTSPLPLKAKKPSAKKKNKTAETEGARGAQGTAPSRQAVLSEQPRARQKAGSTLLTGKRVPADVCDVRGNVIVKKDTVITADVLKRAMAHNKLFELTLCVLSAETPRF